MIVVRHCQITQVHRHAYWEAAGKLQAQEVTSALRRALSRKSNMTSLVGWVSVAQSFEFKLAGAGGRRGPGDSPFVPLAGLTRDNLGRLELVSPLAVMTRYKGICVRIRLEPRSGSINGQYLFCVRAFCDEIEFTALNLQTPWNMIGLVIIHLSPPPPFCLLPRV